jgi:ABC-type transport system substrate-binding protein
MYLINRGDQVDPNPYLHQYFRTGVSKRIRGFSDPKVDELLKKEAETVNSEQRLVALRQAQSAIMEAAPAVFLYTLKASYGVSNRVVWKPRADGYKFGQTMQMK